MDDPELVARIEALEKETAAYSAMFSALADQLGPRFLDVAAELVQLTGFHSKSHPLVRERMTEALRIIDQIRAGSDRKPKPGHIV